ncbi:hypothetical protein K7432_015426 [Basidiobolus ranarum]|uniref:Uncharacterized protein n=1 Tax=Basidiobolus ranarum TaxID=34480 RepID=A0ABR2VP50_9FUNG
MRFTTTATLVWAATTIISAAVANPTYAVNSKKNDSQGGYNDISYSDNGPDYKNRHGGYDEGRHHRGYDEDQGRYSNQYGHRKHKVSEENGHKHDQRTSPKKGHAEDDDALSQPQADEPEISVPPPASSDQPEALANLETQEISPADQIQENSTVDIIQKQQFQNTGNSPIQSVANSGTPCTGLVGVDSNTGDMPATLCVGLGL